MRPTRAGSSFALFCSLALLTASACSSSSSGGSGGSTGSGGGGGVVGIGGAGGIGGHGVGGVTGGGGTTGTGGVTGTGGRVDAGVDVRADAPTDVPAEAGVDAPGIDATVTDAAGDSTLDMALTSTELTEGAAFMALNTCAGVNTSPPLTWTPGPTGTMSYVVSLTDLSIAATHWVIYNIPGTTMALPEALPGDTTLTTPPVGAMQLHRVAFFGAGGAYRGPCPSGATHVYQFEVNAIPTAKLPPFPSNATTEQILTLARSVSLGHGVLSGTSNASTPPADAGGQ